MIEDPQRSPRLGARLRRFRERLRPDPARPARVWARERWKSLAALAALVLGVWTLDAWLLTCGFDRCPSPAEIRAFRAPEGGRILDRDGALLGRLEAVRRTNVELAQVPLHVQQAFIATEDRRFYDHRGLDARAVIRSILRNVRELGVREGFSTISMQVARNAFVRGDYRSRSFPKKLVEMRIARLLERTLTKDQILELYLNIIYLGNGAYGVEAASRDLFGKSVEDLTVAQGAVLAALPKGPSAYTPRRHPERARRRRDLVLSLMAREGFLDSSRAARARQESLKLAKQSKRTERRDDSYALDAVRQLVDSVLEASGAVVGDLTVYTTLDRDAQRAADRAVLRRADAIARESRSWYGRGRAPVQGALVALDPRTGDIRALVGGSRYERGGFNRALEARRQPGSAFKPFVYAAALATGFTPATIVDDEPVSIEEGGRIWQPANYGNEYLGPVTFRRALVHSANAAAVRVSRAVGEPRVVAAARRNGIASALSPVPSIALGAEEVTPLELVTAYAPFANGGWRVRPRLVQRIEAADGTVLWQQDVARVRVMDPRDAYQLTSMLRSVVDRGTGRAVRNLGIWGPVAGKTGTTNDGTDVWFVGYTPTLVAGVWFGHDTPQPLTGNAAGGRLAAPAWAEFYRDGWEENEPESAWEPPDGLVMRTIDAETGELAGEWCPVTQEEWFKPGTEPAETCREHEGYWPEPEWLGDIEDRISRALRRIFRY